MMKSEIIITKRLPDLEIKVDEIPGITAPLIEGRKVDIETSSGGVPILKTFTIPKATPTGNYDIVFTGLGLSKFARIQANMSYGDMFGSSDCSTLEVLTDYKGLQVIKYEDGTLLSYLTTYLIYINTKDIGGIFYKFRANFVKFIDNGIRINITKNSAIEDIELVLTFYK